MSSLVATLGTAKVAIRTFNAEVDDSPELAARLGQVHAFYALEESDGTTLFGSSKFIGYQGLTAEIYLRDYKRLNGLNTEHALKKWFEEVRYGTPAYNQLAAKLTTWMGRHGKRLREGRAQKTRIMVIRPEFQIEQSGDDHDRRLLDLLIAVADLLPTSQRHELRAAL